MNQAKKDGARVTGEHARSRKINEPAGRCEAGILKRRKMGITLGDRVKDSVSGFTGIATARHSYLNGCDRITIQPRSKSGLELFPECTFDEPQLTVVEAKVIPQGSRDTGGKYTISKNIRK